MVALFPPSPQDPARVDQWIDASRPRFEWQLLIPPKGADTMEPTLQFDPANLAVWYRSLEGEESSPIDETARMALMCEHKRAIDAVRAISDNVLRTRCAHILSAVVHEQRHFVDVLLTSYGQSMIRQFTSLLINI